MAAQPLVVGGQLVDPVGQLVTGELSLAVAGEDAGDAGIRPDQHSAVGALFLDDVAAFKAAVDVDDDRLLHPYGGVARTLRFGEFTPHK